MEHANYGRSEPAVPEPYVLRDERQCSLLYDAVTREHFSPFIGRELSMSEAATELEVSLDSMAYRVRRLLQAGLLQVVGERRRAGRSIKLYRSSHDHYVLPFTSTPFADLEEFSRALLRPTFERLVPQSVRSWQQTQGSMHLFRRQSDGAVWFAGTSAVERESSVDKLVHHGVVDFDTTMHLTEEEARDLAGRLLEMLRESRKQPGQGTQPYTLTCFLLPVQRD